MSDAMNEVVERCAAAAIAAGDRIPIEAAMATLLRWRDSKHQGACPHAEEQYSAACPRCLYDDECAEARAVLSALRPGDELPGGLVVIAKPVVEQRKPETLADCGWEPGEYLQRCSQCREQHIARKLSWRCYPCASAMLAAAKEEG